MTGVRRLTAAAAAFVALLLGGIVLGASLPAQQDRWEYHVAYGNPTSDALNKAGAEGWELVSVLHSSRSYAGAAEPDLHRGYRVQLNTADWTTAAIFKRPAR